MQYAGYGLRRIHQPVEKVVVGPVGGPGEPKNKAETLPKRRIRLPNRAPKRARRSFSTGCHLPRTPLNKGKRKGRSRLATVLPTLNCLGV